LRLYYQYKSVIFTRAMAKFTIFFKDKAIQSYIYDSGIIHIGRDNTNDIVIDNLTVAPAHAVVTVNSDNCIIKQLSDKNPLIINKEETKESFLNNNDVISIGKYRIIYSTTESIATDSNTFNAKNKDVESLNQKLEQQVSSPDANLQILEGQHIGRILPLKKAMTRFGHAGTGVVVIAKRKDGFYISSLESTSNTDTLINRDPLGDKTVHLKDNDIILINKVSMQFFLES